MKAIIAEKETQAVKLAAPFKHTKRGLVGYEIYPCEVFPNGALLTWCSGHVFEIVEPDEMDPSLKEWRLETLPMIPESFKYKVIPSKAKRFKAIKSVLQDPRITHIICAGDPAREGELIVQLAVKMSGVKKPLQRLWATSLTPAAVKKAFENLRDIKETMPLYYEATARSYADWLVGMNGTRAYTLLIQQKEGIREHLSKSGSFSVGRVQSPVNMMIVNRERAIQSFVSEPFFEVGAKFNAKSGNFTAKYYKDNQSRLSSKKEADDVVTLCEGKPAKIARVDQEQKVIKAPSFFSLSSLQEKANKVYKYPIKKTLDITQELYLKEFVSYPRTNSQHVTPDEAFEFPNIINNLMALDSYGVFKRHIKRNITEDKRYVDASKVSDHYAIIPTDNVPNLNELNKDERNIYDLIVKSFIAAHCDPAKITKTEIETVVGELSFLSRGEQILDLGWKHILGEKEKETKEVLPLVDTEEIVEIKDLDIKNGKTTPPKRYTEGELVTAMLNAGREVEDAEHKQILKQTVGLGEESSRAGIVEKLKTTKFIYLEKNRIVPTQKAFILADAIEKTVLGSPRLTAQWETKLKQIGEGKASAKEFIQMSKKLASKLVKDALADAPNWDFKTQIETIENDKFLGACPKCGKGIIDKQKLYGCSGYQDNGCTFTLPKKMLSKSITPKNIKKLLDKGKTTLIKGFKGKTTFDAYVIFKDKSTGDLGFEFAKKR